MKGLYPNSKISQIVIPWDIIKQMERKNNETNHMNMMWVPSPLAENSQSFF